MTTNGTVPKAGRRARFASGAATRLELSDGDWVLVHAELTYGQQRRLAAAGVSGVPSTLVAQGEGEPMRLDLAAYDLERLVTWVMDWSFTDEDGGTVLVSRQAIEALHPDTAAEINAALDRHIEALDAKKAPSAGASAPATTSLSVASSAGAGSTS